MEKLVRDNTELISIFLKNILPNRWNSNKIFVPLLLSFITFIIENRPLFLHYPHSISIRHFSFQRFRYFCFYPRSPFSNACSPFSKLFDEASLIRHACAHRSLDIFSPSRFEFKKKERKEKNTSRILSWKKFDESTLARDRREITIEITEEMARFPQYRFSISKRNESKWINLRFEPLSTRKDKLRGGSRRNWWKSVSGSEKERNRLSCDIFARFKCEAAMAVPPTSRTRAFLLSIESFVLRLLFRKV